ncbi:hypothetical protein [Hydrogenophaga sp.]|uniref:hypothetical protein n=1 Tax=Hydrogenophaga sp. TaxID=1904254 RepID=UPI00263017D9|nr:hypothetical protein [Hydrogenophaga sp.]MCW5655538.1 hypothetical protein [Hydrogenophaga sp.]
MPAVARVLRFLAIAFGAGVLLAVAGVATLYQWTGSDGFRQRVEHEAGAALGVPVRLARVSVAVWPLPAVVLEGLDVQADPPLTLARVVARPSWSALLVGRLQVDVLVLRQAVLPQATVVLLAARLKGQEAGSPPAASVPGPVPVPDRGLDLGWLPRRVVLDDVTWVDARGRGTTVQAAVDLLADGWPGAADVKVLAGVMQGASATLRRAPDLGPLAWTLALSVGSGTVQGPLRLTPPGPGSHVLVLEGELRTRGLEVAVLTAPSRPLSGWLDADTTLSARIDTGSVSADAVTQALRTQTRFTVHEAVVHGLDLARAVASVGLSRGGLTALDTLSGQVNTRGQTIALTHLVARSGVLAASGEVTVSPARALSGRIRVDMTRGAGGQVVGVPLVVGGTLDEPSVTLTRAALLGAAIGTAIMPGVGTGAGANLGDRIGEGLKDLFGK